MIKEAIALIIVALATNGLVEIIHHGSIFDGVRNYLETKWLEKGGFRGKLASGILCPFCVSFWISLMFSCILAAGSIISWYWVPLFWYSGARLAQLINDILRSYLRTPGSEIDDWIE